MVQCEIMETKSIGETVQMVLSLAKRAHRVTLGFADAIKLLSKTPEDAQFCFLAEPERGDSATHMNEVLLQAFCYEHGIYIIKVDDSRKMGQILDTITTDVTCVLISKHQPKENSQNDQIEQSSKVFNRSVSSTSIEEDLLVNFCERTWQNAHYNVIKLPES